jgi:hypothetical protein
MNRITIPIVAVAIFLAACGSAATLSSSSAKDRLAPVGAVQLNGGTNAGDTSDITNRPNPPISKVHKPAPPAPPTQPQLTLPPGVPTVGDRCSGVIGTGVAGNRAGTGRHLPQLMCAVE